MSKYAIRESHGNYDIYLTGTHDKLYTAYSYDDACTLISILDNGASMDDIDIDLIAGGDY